MVLFEVVKGRKSDGDFLIKIYSYGEVWSLEHVLRLLKIIFDSEKANYPVEKGLRGAAYLLNAITEIAFGRDVELVLRDYQLKRKNGSKVQIIEKLGSSEPKLEASKPIERLHEVLE
jgi:hypothetical protein